MAPLQAPRSLKSPGSLEDGRAKPTAALASSSWKITHAGPLPSFHCRAPRQDQGPGRERGLQNVKQRILRVHGGPLGCGEGH